MAAPTLVAFAEIENSIAASTNLTTASVSWQTNDVIVLMACSEGNGETISAPTTTGSGVSFGAAQKSHNTSASDTNAVCYAAVASATSSGTYSIQQSGGGTKHMNIGVWIFRGSAGIGNSASSTGSSRTVSLTPTGVDGSICWIVGDWAAAATVVFSPTATTHSNVAPGPTASPVSVQASPSYTYYYAELDDQTSGAANSYGVGGAGTGPFTIIAIETKASAAAAKATVPPIYNVPPVALHHSTTW